MRRTRLSRLFICCTLLIAVHGYSGGGLIGQDSGAIEDVVLHPIASGIVACTEHAVGDLALGDALGKDCMVIRRDTMRAPDRPIPSLFQGDGLENEDWYGWEASLLAPCNGRVMSTRTNPVNSRPGQPPDRDELKAASNIVFECSDGVHVVYAHPRHIQVQSGDSVAAGEVVAEIGNNGNSFFPHVHVGAWRGDTPFQIRFDLRALGELVRSR
jgi:hypothetical protein